jgi:hypothetical protein
MTQVWFFLWQQLLLQRAALDETGDFVDALQQWSGTCLCIYMVAGRVDESGGYSQRQSVLSDVKRKRCISCRATAMLCAGAALVGGWRRKAVAISR